MPWDQLHQSIANKFDFKRGTEATSYRIIIGSFFIKHFTGASDAETLEQIRENPYMQKFLGLSTFHPAPLFKPSRFSEWRKQLGGDVFKELSLKLIKTAKEAFDSDDKTENES
jgi:hypothetical protein